jgi:hypothetical protein
MIQIILAFERILYLLIHYVKNEETKHYELYIKDASLDNEQLVDWISKKIRFLKEILRETLVKLLQHSPVFKENSLKGFLHLFQVIVLSFLCHKWNIKVSNTDKKFVPFKWRIRSSVKIWMCLFQGY